VATVARLVGDVELAEDAVQEACVVALAQWTVSGVPANPRGWLIGTARHKAVDALRREARRPEKEVAAMRGYGEPPPAPEPGEVADDRLALIFACCHPALDPGVRVCLTLRSVCGLATAEIANLFLTPEPTMAQRLVRAKRKIRQAGIALRVPTGDALGDRLGDVLRVVYLVFTEGHRASAGDRLIRPHLCAEAIRLARGLAQLLPGEPEVIGLLALLLLVDARRAGRLDDAGELVLLADQDRTRWDRAEIAEGAELVERALRMGRPGPYQIQSAIAACHSTAPDASATDWSEIVGLYQELFALEPTPVVAANQAAAVAMRDGNAAGLALLDELAADPRIRSWPQLQVARGELLRGVGEPGRAAEAYRAALGSNPPGEERAFIERRLAELGEHPVEPS
jgi:RNA polymerase sigma-70 factor (ECF subfamily)